MKRLRWGANCPGMPRQEVLGLPCVEETPNYSHCACVKGARGVESFLTLTPSSYEVCSHGFRSTEWGETAAAPPAGIVSAVPFWRPCWSRYLRTDLEGSAHTRTPRGESPQKAENWGMTRKVAKPTVRSLDRRSETSNRGSFLLTAQGLLSTLLSLKVFLWQGNCGNQLLSYPTPLGLIPENQWNNSSEEYISQEEAPKRVRWMSFCFFSQFSSVAQSCLTLCNPMDCNTPGFPVHRQLPEFTQTHAHWVGDAIQPSHPLSSPSPLAFNLSQDYLGCEDLFCTVLLCILAISS